jgi:hypothetical protein
LKLLHQPQPPSDFVHMDHIGQKENFEIPEMMPS